MSQVCDSYSVLYRIHEEFRFPLEKLFEVDMADEPGTCFRREVHPSRDPLPLCNFCFCYRAMKFSERRRVADARMNVDPAVLSGLFFATRNQSQMERRRC